ncbi:putative phosphatase regulatory subunit-domain-containing protein [Cerioporus squamosus]|nr:putative phosphatase regulatory subunit-domain-containing protein [Cerioporus squamosus]
MNHFGRLLHLLPSISCHPTPTSAPSPPAVVSQEVTVHDSPLAVSRGEICRLRTPSLASAPGYLLTASVRSASLAAQCSPGPFARVPATPFPYTYRLQRLQPAGPALPGLTANDVTKQTPQTDILMSTVLNLHTYAAPMDYYSRHSNTAGAPLPRIPRRSSSSRSFTLATVSAPTTPPATIQRIVSAEAPLAGTSAVPTVLVVQPPTPPRAEPAQDDASSSSSGSESYVEMHPRTKRTRTPKMQPFRSPADSTPTPAVLKSRSASQLEKGVAFPARQSSAEDTSGNETPRASSSNHSPRPNLHIDLDDLKKPLALGESSASVTLTTNVRAEGASNRASSAPQAGAASIARKKSGEPLKSSLKSRRPVVRGDLSVITGEALASTKSEPSTPMATKSVHFDARLERVKLFLAEQKPLAISREGSPTDTSGTESDFPSAIYGFRRGEEEEKTLTMQLTNKPAVPRADADLTLEDLTLSEDGTSLNGRVRVRNLAFEKWVAVRFTVDSWQTTSEVTAKYFDSVPGGVFDRFSFTIRLGDMLARIEEKTLFFALRYNVAGREIWDNNNGENYKVIFAKVARPRPMPTSTSESGLASLKSKLETVAKGQETVGGFKGGKSGESPKSSLGICRHAEGLLASGAMQARP